MENGKLKAMMINKKFQNINRSKVEGKKQEYFGAEYDSYRASTGYRGDKDSIINMFQGILNDARIDVEPQPQDMTQPDEEIDWESVEWLDKNENGNEKGCTKWARRGRINSG